jgi:REP-associated tyrosine transposase
MSLRAYSEINLHIVWRVKHDQPVLQDEIESQVQRFLRGRAVETAGVYFHAVGGTDDHVHLVVGIPPTLAISDWVGEIKGACSHTINHEIANRDMLHWQKGYGVVSFGTRDLPWVVSYVKEQRSRHAAGRAELRLERVEPHDKADSSAEG